MTWLPVVTGVVGVLFGYALNSRREHLAWLRDKRLQAISNLLDDCWTIRRTWRMWYLSDEAINGIAEPMPLSETELEEIPRQFQRRITDMELVSPQWLYDEVNSLRDSGLQILHHVSHSFTPTQVYDRDQHFNGAPFTHDLLDTFEFQIDFMLDKIKQNFGYNMQGVASRVVNRLNRWKFSRNISERWHNGNSETWQSML